MLACGFDEIDRSKKKKKWINRSKLCALQLGL